MKSRFRSVLVLCLFLCASLGAQVRSLTILHVNDLHARLRPLDDGHGGFAYLAAEIREQRAHCSDCILLNAGDLVQGSPVSTIFHGLPVYQIANLFGFDAATLGNHEFDYGWPQAKKFISTANYPIVTANLVNSKGQLMTPKPYVILKVNGLRVAVVGLMTETLKTLTKPAQLEDWHTTPLIEAARKYAAEARRESDLVVALTHIEPREERAILEQVPDVSVIVSGHAHDGLREAVSRDRRVIVRVRAYGEELGRLDLKVDTQTKSIDDWKWKAVVVDDAKIQPVAEVAEQVGHWEGEVASRVDQPLCVASHAFNKRELKGMIEQAMRDETGADFAWMNMGGIRDLLPKGQILVRHIWDMMPFDNTVVVGTFKGRDLPKVVVNRPVDPDREYTLAVSDYTAANQETAENLRTTGLVFPHEVGTLRDIIVDWCRKKKVLE
jgi:2',3'-cyclic-nucleotide 2'-phosphodiesterase (5'-nucleotidase family)